MPPLTVLRRMLCAWMAAACATLAGASGLTLANTYRTDVDVRAYWVSEKYDGIRAHWDGQQLHSRQGIAIDAPAWFTQHWPAQPMDGELWAGRGQFAAVQSTIGQGAKDEAGWHALRYMVFDLPTHKGSFLQRQQALQKLVADTGKDWVQAAPQWQVTSQETLMRQLRSMSKAGSEGLMLRRADSPYRAGRSDDLIKLKLFEDAEAVVVAHLPGKGKYQGMTGALLVAMPSGQRFKIGSGLSDANRLHPPPVGSTITYRFNGHHPSGLPRFARYWRLRTDSAQPHGLNQTP